MAKIAAAVGSSATAKGDKDLSARLEKAMADEIMKCLSEGVTDPAEMRERQIAAKDKALAAARGETEKE